MESQLALGGQDHKLGKVVEGADEVTYHVRSVEMKSIVADLNGAAVADQVVGAAGPGHLPNAVLGAALADVVEDDPGAIPSRHLRHRVQVAVSDF